MNRKLHISVILCWSPLEILFEYLLINLVNKFSISLVQSQDTLFISLVLIINRDFFSFMFTFPNNVRLDCRFRFTLSRNRYTKWINIRVLFRGVNQRFSFGLDLFPQYFYAIHVTFYFIFSLLVIDRLPYDLYKILY